MARAASKQQLSRFINVLHI